MAILLFGDSIIDSEDIVEVSEKNITFNVKHTKKNPKPKPKGFFAKMAYSDTVTYFEEESYFFLKLKVKSRVQMRGKVDDNGNVSMQSNQVYDFYTVCNDKKLIDRVRQDIAAGSTEKGCEIGNYFIYFGMLRFPNYVDTNVLVDETIKSKRDFIEKYL